MSTPQSSKYRPLIGADPQNCFESEEHNVLQNPQGPNVAKTHGIFSFIRDQTVKAVWNRCSEDYHANGKEPPTRQRAGRLLEMKRDRQKTIRTTVW